MSRRYFEDFHAGQEIALGSRVVTEEEVIAFATQYDPQPFHVDPEAAATSIFGRLAASGWHTCAMAMRIVVDNLLRDSSSLGSPGLEQVRWLKPVYPGDTLHVAFQVKEARASQSKPDRGVVVSVWRISNQHGELVCTVEGMSMFGRRPREGGHA
ncbi:MaoC family dehydratase [Pseudoduganella namucuonensis]|uniref:Acyl dehydratase n=1 Tax=Pseudoduganella namucuonensis TaxID=1035707 RepID=A0A1I7JHN0_9BURK|nr:MaoC family dehydratase [Pseudoduganella namucuonensis]SFU84657.1 Acyl dehydratase [Pseudoduganella namucuonensis]